MNISLLNFNTQAISPLYVRRKSDYTTAPSAIRLKSPLSCDTVSFGSIANGGEVLKKLAQYKVPDMYTGLTLLAPRDLERLQKTETFRLPISKMIKIVSHYEDTMLPIDREFFELIKKTSKKHPDIELKDAMAKFFPVHSKKLLKIQQKIFEKIISLACDMPKELFGEFSELMNITTKRLINDPVVLPFSEKEFKYKLGRIAKGIYSENKPNKVRAMKKLIYIANKIFSNEPKGTRLFGRNKMTVRRKLENQMLPHVLKRNSENIQYLKKIFEESALRSDPELQRLMDITSAKIHGFPTYAQFENKSFIHELKKITKRLKDKELAQKLVSSAQSLPTSKENLSAFIVKYANESNDKIGYSMLMNGICSVDHLVAKNNGGLNKLLNYGLCSTEINIQKTNIPFDTWVRNHPETRANCQKYVDRLIELYKGGIFEKVSYGRKKGIGKNYIEDFVNTIYKISPKENRIILDISKLYE